MDEAKKNPECGRNKEQCSPARIVSGKEILKSPGNQGRVYGEGCMSPKWGLIFKDEVSVILMTGFSSCYKKEKLKKSVITLRKGL